MMRPIMRVAARVSSAAVSRSRVRLRVMSRVRVLVVAFLQTISPRYVRVVYDDKIYRRVRYLDASAYAGAAFCSV